MYNFPEDAIIRIGTQGNTIKTDIVSGNKVLLSVTGVSLANSILDSIYDDEHIANPDLKPQDIMKNMVRNGKLEIVSDDIFDKYVIDINGDIKKRTVAKTTTKETTTKETTKKEVPPKTLPPKTEPPKEEKTGKKKYNIKKIVLGSVGAIGTVILIGWALQNEAELKKLQEELKKRDNVPNPTPYTDMVEESGQYTNNITDDDVYESAYRGNEQDTVYIDPISQIDYEYENLGSIVTSDSMELQVKTIDDLTNDKENIFRAFEFEELVVPDDYAAIKALSDLRNIAIANPEQRNVIMSIIEEYILGGSNYINGSFYEGYDNLHPFGKYIAVSIGKGVLAITEGYQGRIYDRDEVINQLKKYSNDAYVVLTGRTSRK